MKLSMWGAGGLRCCRVVLFVLAIAGAVQGRSLRSRGILKTRASYEVTSNNDDDATVASSSSDPASALSARIAGLAMMQKVTGDTIAAQRHAVDVLLQQADTSLQKGEALQSNCDKISAEVEVTVAGADAASKQRQHEEDAGNALWLSVVPPVWQQLSSLLPSALRGTVS
eukprot:TRINITY_DN92286_c0_g1_i1.p1 TRINITY_DN92286_c0_g1~~TRINITY_DN92286_c0_g1_i1.p1  ORF type:complete len:170 (+),score=39.12 TRINITY_DN92286_c0_g1_i1:198-707(+)